MDKRKLPPALRLENVGYRRDAGAAPVLSGVSFTVPAGQWVAIAGRNGSGKSTLLRLIAGLLPASEGGIEAAGTRIGPASLSEIRRRIGIVFANPDNQFVGQTVADDIAFGLENRCLKPEEIERRLLRYAELLEIADLLDRHPAYLSGGQKQRAAIAAVLALEPDIVLFDEAGSMLDESAKRELLAIMRQLREAGGYTMISVTHDSEELLAADRAILLANGTVAADGLPSELLKSERLLEACRLQAPYVLQVCRALRRQGVDVDDYLTEKELIDALWPSGSIMSPVAGKERIFGVL
ncbi:ATP-binding cassette domain-containing protein [Cohnella lubricantis]|uniref:ATP-binding cassette domain-containing protein n=1 Tax=Cohnella lubricantis TaxID=2163172 RepID=A0A841TKY3_9BACL|nr:ATP-binding cassette domain-containing protein [Cohnella lubricantis]MBB6679191.1 ATP-binding cassette domain-containing protein [Cohnella lubricantis]MBP2120674.1 energy-coupling factor transport system ATP-binding protein [Cohnella lubricantis]